jgi:hypothetical protein
MSFLDALLPAEPTHSTPTAGKPSQNIHVPLRTDGIAGSGTLNDPYDASTQAKFDAVMSSLPEKPMHVHLGPSPRDADDPLPFQTAGCYLNSDGTRGSADIPSPDETVIVTERCASISASDNRSFDGGALEPNADRFAMQLGMPSEDSVITAGFEK